MQNKGYTLIEILMVILLLGILSGIIFSTYKNFIQEHKSQSIGVRKEMDLLSLQIYLRKLIGSIGFGVPIDLYKVWNNPQCTDSNLNTFNGSNSTIGLAKNCSISAIPQHDRLYFRSLYATGAKKAGCWWVVTPEGQKQTMAVDKYGLPCEIETNDLCVYLDSSKKKISNLTNCANALQAGFLFYYCNGNNCSNGNNTPPEVFRLHLSEFDANDTAQRQACAPKSAKLMLQRQWNNNSQPIFDCVGGLKFELIYADNPNLPSAVRMCLLVQVSGRMSTKRPVPLNSQCGSFQQGDPDWEYYRWRVIEEIIPLENLRGVP